MAPNGTKTKRENRVWTSCPKNLMPIRAKLLLIYEEEDLYKLGVIPLAQKHRFLPEGFEEVSGEPRIEMDMHLNAPIQGAMKGTAPAGA